MSHDSEHDQAKAIDQSLGDFLGEARQLLARLNEHLRLLDRAAAEAPYNAAIDCDSSVINEMFRAAHSITGLSEMLRLRHINQLAHRIHDALDAIRKRELRLTANVVDVFLQACDRLVVLVERVSDPASDAIDCEDVIRQIDALLPAAGADGAATGQPAAQRTIFLAAMPRDAQPSEHSPAVARWTGARIDHFDGLVDEQSPAKYLAIFIDEAELSIDSMTEVLLGDGDEDVRAITETLLITSHRIKGSAASIGLHRPAKLAHLMEDILQDLRERGESLSPALVDAMLRCIDALRSYVHQLRDGAPESEHFGQLAADLLTAHAPESAPHESSAGGELANPSSSSTNTTRSTEAALTPAQVEAILQIAPQAMPALMGAVRFDDGLLLSGLKARLLYEKLAHEGQVFFCEPAAEQLDESDDLKSFAFAIATNAIPETIFAKLQVAGVDEVTLLPVPRRTANVAAGQPPTSPAGKVSPRGVPAPDQAEAMLSPKAADRTSADAASQPAREVSRPVETLRVDIDRLDQLMNLAGQLVINKARFTRVGDALRLAMPTKQTAQAIDQVRAVLSGIAGETRKPGDELTAELELQSIRAQLRRVCADVDSVQRELQKVAQLRASIIDLGDAVHQLDRVADGIQKSVMDTRMVPIGPLFTRFKRVVRDITRSNQKHVELVIRGEKTELDKRMIDELGDPLIHMVRNSADHGIESPEVRRAAGKPAQGTISLEAFHRGNSIVIQVSDDGKGLDPEHIRRKAIEKGIITEADAERLSEAQSLALIWEPGFSTAEKVTEISGRGMGMDIVRSKIEQLNGAVELTSRKGEGTTFTIKLPLTLAILPSLLVKVDGDVFALPLDAVVEIVTIHPQDVRTVHRRATARVRNRIVSVVRLSELFQWRHANQRMDGAHRSETLVVLGSEGREIGVVVDQPLGEEDIVIKSMAENYRNVPGVAGASILGDGRVSLILDPTALLEMATRNITAAEAAVTTN